MEFKVSNGPPNYQPDAKSEEGNVFIEVHATGSVTSAFSLHVVYEEFYRNNNNNDDNSSDEEDDDSNNNNNNNKNEEEGKEENNSNNSKNKKKKKYHDIDLFLVDHAANDMSLRKR
jgi:cobalamin biosynthesis protein CobT